MSMFIVRTKEPATPPPGAVIKASRPTPAYAAAVGGTTDYFCEAADDAADKLAAGGAEVLKLKDGWYEVGHGGVAIWGNGRFWELRDTLFTVSEASTR